jgi:outer membrane protein assembly factor BamA
MSLIEGDRRRARAAAGWGTLDCFRTQARFVEQNLAGLGHRLELNGKLSKIGLADPFSGFQSLCAARVRDDPFSQRLNYYAGATLRPRGLFAWNATRWQPEFTVFSERRSSVGAYEQTTEIGALASTTHSLTDRLNATLQYSYTDSRTRADRAVSCTRFGFCRLEDVASFVLRSPQHSVGMSLVFNPLLPTDDPVSGYRWVLDAKYGHASIGKILPIDFGRVSAEFASYLPMSDWLTLALRAQIGAVISPADRSFLLPPAERFYSGGQNSVRGYGQNQLGPGSYIVTSVDTITGTDGTQYGAARAGDDVPRIAPSGGNAMWIANVELRTRRGWPNGLLRWVLFLDAGRVWNTRDVFSVTNADTRATPGIGVRLVTPLGPFRVDVGYNPNSLDSGPAFLVIPGDVKAGTVGRAVCVSPGTDDPLVLGAGGMSSSSSCPATFLPTGKRSLLSRLTFHFSLGNAF